MSREAAAKGNVNGLASRRLIVSGYQAGSQPLVEFRIMNAARLPITIDMTLPQARAARCLLDNAIQALEAGTRRDGAPDTPAGRVPAGEDASDAGPAQA